MRALRLSVPGTVVLALLGGLGGFAVAGDDEALAPDMPHEVSGTLGATRQDVRPGPDGTAGAARGARYL